MDVEDSVNRLRDMNHLRRKMNRRPMRVQGQQDKALSRQFIDFAVFRCLRPEEKQCSSKGEFMAASEPTSQTRCH